MTSRDEQRRRTRDRIVRAAVDSLVEQGYAATTALGVEQRAEVSRGALLHHFPTSEDLFRAAVHRLVELNLEAVRQECPAATSDPDPIGRGLRALHRASRRPSFAAELELWAAARADRALREALFGTESAALERLHEVIDQLFSESVTTRPGYRHMITLTVHLMRGLTISGAISATPSGAADHDRELRDWTALLRLVLEYPALATALTPRLAP